MGSYTGGNLSNGISFAGITGDGRGQTIAIVDYYDDPYATNDLNAFSSYFGLPQFNGSGEPTFQKFNQSGSTAPLPSTDPAGKNNQNGTWEEEESLDIEWAHVMAPMANIILFEASINNLYTAVYTAAHTNGVVVVSMSWSAAESTVGASGESSDDTNDFVTPSGHLGGSATLGGTDLAGNITFLAATGDSGAYGGNAATDTTITPQYPAASPNVVAVGGTTLTVTGSNPNYTYGGETAWGNGNSSGTTGGGGGGISKYESQPSFQSSVVGNFSTSKRTYPDVAIDANPNTGVPIYDSWDFGNTTPWIGGYEGGTSLACPLWAGLVAVADEGRAIAGKGSLDGHNQTLPTLYSLPSTDFHDITSGSNGPSPTYSAGTGYDLVAGIGSPVGNLLVPALAGDSQLAFNQQPTSVTAGSTISPAITVDVEDAAGNIVTSDNSSVTLTIASGPGTLIGTVTVAAVNGVATFGNLSLTIAGNYTLKATDGSLASATSSNFTVTAAAAAKLAYAQQPTSSTVGAAISPAITVDIEDTYGNIVGNATSSVTLATASGPGTLLGTTTVAAVAGVATFGNVSLNVTGNYTLKAVDGSLGNTTSSSFAIGKAATSTVVTSSSGTANYGQSVTFTANVTPDSGSGETGTVQFQIDGGNMGTPVTLSSNTATYATATLSVGNHSIVAVYSGDGNFTASTSTAITQTIIPAWLAVSSAATWNPGTQTLTVTGAATIIGNPAKFGDNPMILDSSIAASLTVDTLVTDGGDGDAVAYIAAITGNGATTVNAGSSLDVGNLTQATLLNNGAAEIDSNGTVGNLTGSGNLTIGNGTSTNTLALATQATSGILSGFSDTQTALTINLGATLDITNNLLLLNYGSGVSPLPAVNNAVAWGAASGGNNTNGTIISSTVNAANLISNTDGKYAVGYADHTEISTVPTGNVEVAYTLAGDANLDGTVDILDYQQLAPHYDEAGIYDWSQGDFNHDSYVDILDYQALAPNYDSQLTAGTLAGAAPPPAPPAPVLPSSATAQPSSAAVAPALFSNTAITSVTARASATTAPPATAAAVPLYRLYTPPPATWPCWAGDPSADNPLASQYGWTAEGSRSCLL